MSALTRGNITSVSGTVGFSSSGTILASNTSRNYLLVHNPSKAANLAFTVDGGTPAVNVGPGVTLNPGGTAVFDMFVPTGPVAVISDTASTPYVVWWF